MDEIRQQRYRDYRGIITYLGLALEHEGTVPTAADMLELMERYGEETVDIYDHWCAMRHEDCDSDDDSLEEANAEAQIEYERMLAEAGAGMAD